jgi:hypothetical protein
MQREVLPVENLERCLQLYALAAQEQDSKELLALTAELNRILEEKDRKVDLNRPEDRLPKSA